ncbi:MAG TPA: FtsX-like permease family protein [Acidimicrobiales bacterium]|nr:FtsX-like permease family protein [Acidimicrobiales bacterium]
MRTELSSATRVIAYRFATTLRRRAGAYVAVAMVIALLGGAAIAAVTGARRTASSFHTLLADTNAPNLIVLTGLLGPEPSGYDAGLIARLAHLPGVARIESEAGYQATEVSAAGRPVPSGFLSGFPQVGLYSSVDGLFYKTNRLIVLSGRVPDPRSRTEVAVTAAAARILGVHVGSTFGLGVIGNRQTGCPACVPEFHHMVTVVGIVTSAFALIVDDTDVAAEVYASPAFTRPLLGCCVDPTISMLQLRGGAREMAATEARVVQLLPRGLPVQVGTSAPAIATADRVLGPDALALWVVGAILAALLVLVASQALGRLLRRTAEDRRVLRDVGASPLETAAEGVPGCLLAIVVGVGGAVGVALGLSPLAPIGPVRAVEPTPGFSLDPTVVLIGAAAIGVVLLTVAAVSAVRLTPHRDSSRDARDPRQPAAALRAAVALGLPASAIAGLHLALARQRGARRASLRSAAVGASLAVTVLVATLTFGASLDQLVARPALYGWNWTGAITAAGGVGVLPARPLAAALGADHDVAAWSGADFGQLRLDGARVAVLGVVPNAPVAPTLLSGHGVRSPDQVVLGTATLASLHASVGGTLVVSGTGRPPATLHVVGTATLPAMGGSMHTEMGTGAILDYRLIPAAQRNLFHLPGGGPNVALVRLRAGSGPEGLARLRRLAHGLEAAAQDSLEVIALLRPAVVANAGTLRSTPSAVAAVLAAGALAGLALALVALVRRTRRELALLRVLGFERHQLVGAVAWQATLVAVVGSVVGVVCGVVLGRWLWTLFAEQIDAVPAPAVPLVAVALVVAGTVVLANALAVLPGLSAARSPASIALRAE